MLPLSTLSLVLSALMVANGAEARIRWQERDGKFVLAPRRTGQEHPEAINEIVAACNTGVCATLAGNAISTLLAAAPECSQQDAADNMITVAKNFTDATASAALIKAAISFRQAEKNTQPDFSTNTGRNSVFCSKAPVNSELNGLVQAQDPSNSGELFSDPAVKGNVKAGSQANTFPFGSPEFLAFGSGGAAAPAASGAQSSAAAPAASSAAPVASAVESSAAPAVTTAPAATNVAAADPVAATTCPGAVTVTVTAGAAAATTEAAAPVASAAESSAAAPVASSAAAPVASGLATVVSTSTAKFGTCTNAGVTRSGGLGGRPATEITFQPSNLADFNHGEALNPQIIYTFICDTFVNKCGGTSDNVASCKALAATITTRDDAAANTWNAGIEKLAFNVGGAVAGATGTVAAADPNLTPIVSTSTAKFGTCTNAGVTRAGGLNGRKATEVTFVPSNLTDFNHGEALNPQIIWTSICDTFVNKCGGTTDNVSQCKAFAATITTRDAAAANTWNTGIEKLAF